MDYLFLALAVTCFAGQFAFTKLYEKEVKQTTVTSLVMLIATGLIGALLYLFVGGFQIQLSPVSLFWAVMLALIMIPYYVVGIKVLALGSLAIYSMFMMLGGMLVPFFYGILFLQEPLSVGKIAGTVLLTVFIILQAVWQGEGASKDNQKAVSWKTKYLFFFLCLIIFFVNGFTGVIAKAHQISTGAVDEISFTVISCALTALLSAVLLPIGFLKNTKHAKIQAASTLKAKPMLIMVLIGAAAYTGSFLHLKAASTVPASVQFPLVSGGVILLSALVSAFLFREKISKKEWLSVLCAFAATFLFAF